MKRRLMVAVAAAACGLIRAQDVPPPPKPQDTGPSLEATMKFIQERVEAVGPVNYISYGHDNKDGSDFTNDFRQQTTKVRANPSTCRVDYHLNWQRDAEAAVDADNWFSLKRVREVKVLTREQDILAADAKNGHPQWSARVSPPVFVLRIEQSNNDLDAFYFFDESMANRVAQAIIHAVELCGGGSKDPF